MDNPIQITPKELLIGLLLLLAIAALVLLIIVLVRFIRTLGKVNQLIDTNKDAINATIKQLPERCV